ncbi:hypothetical protein MHA02_37030 [Methylobacterium haplocladii]|uniref:Uncharacterized protein n=1 Tax=Methylobacterium haplocladii TaxID=1176176 RepID=A0A512IUH5_9HYPH|nr:hypothetical protein MHA02_37030 [Methylobacterium haplocladii]
MRLRSPHNIQSAYSRGELGRHQAMSVLGLADQIEIIAAMSDAGHPLPRPAPTEVAAQIAEVMPLLRAALIAEDEVSTSSIGSDARSSSPTW